LKTPRNNGNAVEEIKTKMIELFELNIFSITPVN
jgi:hypothetical protein